MVRVSSRTTVPDDRAEEEEDEEDILRERERERESCCSQFIKKSVGFWTDFKTDNLGFICFNDRRLCLEGTTLRREEHTTTTHTFKARKPHEQRKPFFTRSTDDDDRV
jgi:hypothetical protein